MLLTTSTSLIWVDGGRKSDILVHVNVSFSRDMVSMRCPTRAHDKGLSPIFRYFKLRFSNGLKVELNIEYFA